MAYKKKSATVNLSKHIVGKPGIAFEIKLDQGVERPRSAGRERLMHKTPISHTSKQQLEEKQRMAEERRNAVQTEKLMKIRVGEECCGKVTRKTHPAQPEGTNSFKVESKPFDEDEIVPALKNKTEHKSEKRNLKKPENKSKTNYTKEKLSAGKKNLKLQNSLNIP